MVNTWPPIVHLLILTFQRYVQSAQGSIIVSGTTLRSERRSMLGPRICASWSRPRALPPISRLSRAMSMADGFAGGEEIHAGRAESG